MATDPSMKLIQKLIRQKSIARVDINVTLSGVYARAFPDSFHPMVKARREAAFAERGGSVSIQEAQKITEDSMFAVATGTGATIEEAVAALAKDAG